MSDLSYTPTFHHKPWIDNVDRVKAGGPDGFNVRFEAIDSDLHQVSTVVATINTLLDNAGPTPPSGTQRLLVPLDPAQENLIPDFGIWTCDGTGAIHPQPDSASSGRGAAATMDLRLPDQATVVSMRMIGHYTGAALIDVRILRFSLFNIHTGDALVQVNLAPPGPANPYDITTPANAAFAVVDNTQFRYALRFEANSVGDTDSVTLMVDSVEIFYTLG
jgi:hypothetical protein